MTLPDAPTLFVFGLFLVLVIAVSSAAIIAIRIAGAHVAERKAQRLTKGATDAIQVATAWQQVQANDFKLEQSRHQLAIEKAGAGTGLSEGPELITPDQVQSAIDRARALVKDYDKAVQEHNRFGHEKPDYTVEIRDAEQLLRMHDRKR